MGHRVHELVDIQVLMRSLLLSNKNGHAVVSLWNPKWFCFFCILSNEKKGVKSTSRVKLRGPQFWNQITCSCSEIHIAVRLIQSYTQQLCTLSDSCFINSGYSFTSWNSYWVHKYISKSKAANCPVRGSTPVLPWRSDTMTFMRGWMSKS